MCWPTIFSVRFVCTEHLKFRRLASRSCWSGRTRWSDALSWQEISPSSIFRLAIYLNSFKLSKIRLLKLSKLWHYYWRRLIGAADVLTLSQLFQCKVWEPLVAPHPRLSHQVDLDIWWIKTQNIFTCANFLLSSQKLSLGQFSDNIVITYFISSNWTEAWSNSWGGTS